MRFYCRPCAAGSHKVLYDSDRVPTHGCSFGHHRLDWSLRRFECQHCVDAGYPDPDTFVGDEDPGRRQCIRGHDGPWKEHPDSAWALGGVQNRIIASSEPEVVA